MMNKLDVLASRSKFGNLDDLVDFCIENRSVALPKLSELSGLSIFELRKIFSSQDFRRLSSEKLSISVFSLSEEESVLRKILDDVLDPETRTSDRVRGAEFLFRQGGIERARESKIDVDHGIRVVFEPLGSSFGGWVSPNPLSGVVGSPKALEQTSSNLVPLIGDEPSIEVVIEEEESRPLQR